MSATSEDSDNSNEQPLVGQKKEQRTKANLIDFMKQMRDMNGIGAKMTQMKQEIDHLFVQFAGIRDNQVHLVKSLEFETVMKQTRKDVFMYADEGD